MNKQLLAAALAVFATYPEAEEVLVCEDGNVFLAERRNLAENHCREARIPAPIVVKREEVEKASKKGARPDAEAAAKEAEEKGAAEAAAKEAEEKGAAEAAAKEAEEGDAAEGQNGGADEEKEGAEEVPANNGKKGKKGAGK